MLADENEYIDDSFVVVLGHNRFLKINKKIYRYNLLKLIK